MLYSIYGLVLDADLAIPGLLPCNAVRGADIRIRLTPGADVSTIPAAERVWYRSQSQSDATSEDAVLTIFRSADDASYRFRYPDGVEFIIDRQGTHVRATWPPTSTLEDVALYLTGPLLGFVLRLRGVVALHASVVAIGNEAVAFVGPAGAGKSTTAAAFAARGYSILTEDVAALVEFEDRFAILPGYPHIGLWPESVEMLFGSPDALPPFTAGWDKRCFSLTDPDAFVGHSLPLRAIYLLSDRVSGAPRVTPAPAGSAMITLLGNIYGNLLFHRELRVHEMDVIRRLATAVSLRTVTAGSDGAGIPALCEVVLTDLAGGGASDEAMPGTTRDVQHF